MAVNVRSLEQALRVWEQVNYLISLRIQMRQLLDPPSPLPFAGPIVHAPEFRKYLLDRSTVCFDVERFIGPSELQSFQEKNSGVAFVYLPICLKSWSQNSRRVYQLSPDLQVMLGYTSLKGIRWSDIRLPFESFALSLETPNCGSRRTFL